jgi:carbon monoxide dehydrogenase subunit G
MKEITLHGKWLIKAPTEQVFKMMMDFEKFPVYFPKVAESIRITNHEDTYL